MRSERDIHFAPVGQVVVFANGEVIFVEASDLEVFDQHFERRFGSRGDHDAGGSGIKTVDDARLTGGKPHGSHFRITPDEGIGESPGFSRPDRRRRLPGGFVHHHQIIAFQKHD